MKFLIIMIVVVMVAAAEEMVVVVRVPKGTNPEHVASNLRYMHPHPSLGDLGYHVYTLQHQQQQQQQIRWRRDEPPPWHEVQARRRRFNRTVIETLRSEPLYHDQWHLQNYFNGANVERAWEEADVRGAGVTVAIVDDGLQWTHPDLRTNYDAEHSWDFNHNDGDPSPDPRYDAHGTSAAGVCCAAANGHCGVGAAPEASLVGLRLIAGPITDYDESVALSHHGNAGIDIYSCSWGPADDGAALRDAGHLTHLVLERQTVGGAGRQGRGNIYVWAGGNGRYNHDNCNYDGYAASPFTIAVGALDHHNDVAWYSEPGAALAVSAPSSGAYGYGITTTDLVGRSGYAEGECTADFGGTSSAAPLVAGTVALMLEANPQLTWLDVQHILARSSQKIKPFDHGWYESGTDNYHHHHDFGWGMLDAARAVALASTWAHTGLQWERHVTIQGTADCREFVSPSRATNMVFVEHVILRLVGRGGEAPHRIDLVSPRGGRSQLWDSQVARLPREWRFLSLRHWGEDLTTTTTPWRLEIDASSPLHLQRCELTIHYRSSRIS